MSAVEILAELPRLTSEERSIVRHRLRELDERDDLQFLHESADAMFQDASRAEMIKLIERATPDDRKFLEKLLQQWRATETDLNEAPSQDDPFYRLHELAVDDLKPLTNTEIDKIVYGVD